MDVPDLEWRGPVPVSRRFGDVYYNAEDGLAESRHVFLDGNELPARWVEREYFQIGEIGFGTGLNFLTTLRAFRETSPAGRLAYFSCERYPLNAADLRRALSAFEEVGAEAEELLRVYPSAFPGVHRLSFADGRVSCTLLWGDALESLAGLTGAAFDAWYLDGFAPDRNPELWQEGLFAEIARLSRPGATAATFSVAGAVRRHLQAVGFTPRKTPGFGRKREMLRAVYTATSETQHESDAAPFVFPVRPGVATDGVVVIGAGLAGTAACEALTRRGLYVTLIEREPGPARAASGNAAGLAFPWLTAEPTPLSRLSLSAFVWLLSHLDRMEATEVPIARREAGVLQLFHDEAVARRLTRGLAAHELPQDFARIVGPEQAGRLAGVPVGMEALYYPRGSLVSPRALCEAHLAASRSRGLLATVYHREALRIGRTATGWEARDATGTSIAAGSALVLATATDTTQFDLTDWVPLRAVRGQVLRVPAGAHSAELRTAICYDGYVTPAVSVQDDFQEHWVGATFEDWNHAPELLPEQNLRLWERAGAVLPAWTSRVLNAEQVERWPGRVAFRSASRDRFPVIGPVPDRTRADRIRSPEDWYRSIHQHSALFLHTAHGSRGLLTAPFGAELIAGMIAGETPPLPADLVRALHPGRFLARAKKRDLRLDS